MRPYPRPPPCSSSPLVPAATAAATTRESSPSSPSPSSSAGRAPCGCWRRIRSLGTHHTHHQRSALPREWSWWGLSWCGGCGGVVVVVVVVVVAAALTTTILNGCGGLKTGAATTVLKRKPVAARSPSTDPATTTRGRTANSSTASGAMSAAATRTRRSPPHRAYCCGWQTCLADAIFPDATVLPAVQLKSTTNGDDNIGSAAVAAAAFQDDDVLLYSCGGPCPISPQEMDQIFPGYILTVNGENDPSTCRIGNRNRRHQRSRIVSIDRIGGGHVDDDNDNQLSIDRSTPTWRNASTYYAAIVLASQPMERRKEFVDRVRGIRRSRSRASALTSSATDGEYFLIYANSHCVPYREQAYRSLATLGEVHYGGACSGRVTTTPRWWNWFLPHPPRVGIVSDEIRSSAAGWGGNQQLFRRYRFVLCMENMNQPGYISEKILVAFLAPSIPIYYGTDEVFDVFSRDAFVYYDIHNPQPALDQVAYLERNRTAYQEMLHAPILAHGHDTFDKYFSLWDDHDGDNNRSNDGRGGANGRLKWAIRERIGFGREGPTRFDQPGAS